MSLEKLESIVSRVFFFGAFLLLVMALVERAANLVGYTILARVKAATILEAAAVLLVFVVAIQLREIRELLRRKP